MQSTDRPPARAALGALLIDLVCVVAFCAVGRRTHTEGLTVGGIAETSWPFLTGTALGWLLSRGWRRPVALAPTGLTVWVCTVVVAMLLRRATSQGTAMSFIVVASLTTAVLLLGWRAATQLVSRR
ncbi:MAG: DUF3054 domain-containing protein [Actinomycetia bacterium]|nr:DUF3054 domain-containing protein [Actinomycetes bacterium]